MNRINRRSVLKGVTLGSGALVLSPFLKSISAADQLEVPKRFVFVVKTAAGWGFQRPSLVTLLSSQKMLFKNGVKNEIG